nr:immunoglobulin heavy chain junction region [Mus musculus]
CAIRELRYPYYFDYW